MIRCEYCGREMFVGCSQPTCDEVQRSMKMTSSEQCELDRIMQMTPEEVDAELRKEGVDPEQVRRDASTMLAKLKKKFGL